MVMTTGDAGASWSSMRMRTLQREAVPRSRREGSGSDLGPGRWRGHSGAGLPAGTPTVPVFRPEVQLSGSAQAPSDGQVPDEGRGELRRAQRAEPALHPGEEIGAPGRAQRARAGLSGQVGQVVLGAVANLEGVAQARDLLEESGGLGREVPRADLPGRRRRVARI